MKVSLPRSHQVLMIILVALGLFLRLFHQRDAMYYMNDQGHMAIIARAIVQDGHLPQAGPRISLSRGAIPPFNYYLVAAFEQLGSDPLFVAVGYVFLNMLAGLALWQYSYVRFGEWVAVSVLGVVMLSAAMVEFGRSIWEPHPTFAFISFYLLVTELSFRKRNLWGYSLGVFLFMLALVSYPASLLLLPYVWARAAHQLRSFDGMAGSRAVWASIVLVGGMLIASFAPWILSSRVMFESTAVSVVQLVTSFVSPGAIMLLVYANVSTMIHDIFGLSVSLPPPWVGATWLKIAVSIGLVLVIRSLRKKEVGKSLQLFLSEQGHWVLFGLLVPASFGMKLMPHRLLPFYPFVSLWLGCWIVGWIRQKHVMRQSLAGFVAAVFLVSNIFGWYKTTINKPRQDYTRTKRAASIIAKDVRDRRIPVTDVGAHYFRPDDQNDFFGAHFFYMLRLLISYPVSFVPLGNELSRGKPEHHAVVYVVCDGFSPTEEKSGCIEPFARRHPQYFLNTMYRVTDTEIVVVFQQV